MVGGRRRRHATPRRTSKRNRHSHSVHTLQGFPSEHSKSALPEPHTEHTYNRHVVVLAKR